MFREASVDVQRRGYRVSSSLNKHGADLVFKFEEVVDF